MKSTAIRDLLMATGAASLSTPSSPRLFCDNNKCVTLSCYDDNRREAAQATFGNAELTVFIAISTMYLIEFGIVYYL